MGSAIFTIWHYAFFLVSAFFVSSILIKGRRSWVLDSGTSRPFFERALRFFLSMLLNAGLILLFFWLISLKSSQGLRGMKGFIEHFGLVDSLIMYVWASIMLCLRIHVT